MLYAMVCRLLNSNLSRLQKVQNCDARLILCIRKCYHIAPIFIKLHWFPIEYRFKFKILLQIFKVLNGMSPSCSSDLIQKHVPSRTIRSNDANLLFVLFINTRNLVMASSVYVGHFCGMP